MTFDLKNFSMKIYEFINEKIRNYKNATKKQNQ